MHELLSTKERIKILSYVLELEIVGVEETAKKLGISKGLVSKVFHMLEKEGIAKKKGGKFRILDSPKTRELKRFLNFLILYPKLSQLKEDWIKSLGVYGSFSRGENRRDSDVDIWIYAEKEDIMKSAKLQRKLRDVLERNVDLLVLTPEKVKRLKKDDPIFYYSLVYGSMIIWGESLERL
ncbi:nucleotidyltransferase domain-containing protein [Thermococcus chitonophagus]|uniref:Nucleotidyltransferase, fused to N-terminal DNA-binding domain n=1 Tax=Thermococcus chitonophagus TaxID=54262 RepID=A0A160VUY8_9EURY|nr:nucleotidyltransferase domain-containing protein [Thermococcus chitonophagus]CUX77521.1 Nucleotidyltransferase, fused to N-terminal DNA-binding domain [Thermococcus chitonophagus]